MSGLKIEDIRESGRTTRCMEMVSLNGLMEENMKATMSMTKNMESELSFGLMDADIRDLGRMVNSMAEGNIT